MAIEINGTTVIDDSRQLANIAGLDATTVTTLRNAGTHPVPTGYVDIEAELPVLAWPAV